MTIEAVLPDGRVLEFPDGTPTSVVQAAVKRMLAPAAPTIGGQVKEAFKGLVPGAVGMVEQAAVGASALLPDEYEPAVRRGIADVAGAAKAPFAAAPGYEQTIGRKVGEAVGSMAPFLAAAPFGIPGAAAAAAMGVGAGAGEARVRAEQAKATEEERAAATALGVIPGALEMFAPFKIIKRLPDEITSGGVQMVKRALAAGGEEAAQEAASGFAQNLIAKGIYKPEQELVEGLGEQAAYGGAAGAIAQGVLDMALGRRAKGAAGAPQPEDAAAEEEAQRQRELARGQERAERSLQAQADTELLQSSDYAALEQRKQALKQAPTPQARQQIAEIEQAQAAMNTEMVERLRMQTAPAVPTTPFERELAQARGLPVTSEQSVFAAEEPQQMEIGGLGMPGRLPVAPEVEPAALTTKELEAAGQMRLPLRRTPAGAPVSEPEAPSAPVVDDGIPEPVLRKGPQPVHPSLTKDAIGGRAYNWSTSQKGKEFVEAITAMQPDQVQELREEYAKRPDKDKNRQAIFNAIYPETLAGGDVRPEPAPEQRAAEPSVGVPVAGGPDVTDTLGAEPSDGAGVEPSAPVAAAEPVVAGAPTPAVDPFAQLVRGVEAAPAVEPEAEPTATETPAEPARPSAFTIPKRSLFSQQREAEESQQTPGVRFYKGDAYRTPEPQEAPKTPIPDAELRQTIDTVTRSLGLPVDTLTVLDSISQIAPGEKPGSRAGAIIDGKAYLFRDGIPSGPEGQKTVFHELLHKGLRVLFPPREYVQTLSKLYKQSAFVRERADAWLEREQSQADIAKIEENMGQPMTADERSALAVDEILAELAEARKTPGTVRQLGNWLANIAGRMGLKKLARSIRTMGMSQLESFVDDALRAAGGQVPGVPAAPVFRTAKKGPAPTPQGQAALETLRNLGTYADPEPTKTQRAVSALTDAAQNPREVLRSAQEARTNIIDTFGNNVWSTDFALQRLMRKAVLNAQMAAPEAMDFMLRVNTAQAANSSALAAQFMRDGAAKYDPQTYTFKSVKSKANFVAFEDRLAALAKKHNVTVLEATRMWHTASEARRLQDIERTNEQIRAKVRQLAASAGNQKAAEELSKKIIEPHRPPQEIAEGLQLFKTIPELNELANLWDTFRGNMIDVMVEGGLHSREEAETLFDNAAYVPFLREGQVDANKGPKEYLSGLLTRRTPKIKGSVRPVADILDNTIRVVEYSVERSVRNRKAADMADALVALGFAEKLPGESGQPNEVRVYKNGEEVYYDVKAPGLMDAFQGVEGIAIPALKWFSQPADWLRKSVVLFPLFPVLQVPQDSFAAMFSSGLKPHYALTIPARAVKEFAKTLIGASRTHEDLKRFGVVGQKDISAAVRRNDLEAAAGLRSSPGIFGKASKVLHHISMASDNAVRQAVYEASMAQGLSRAEALNKAYETINFRYRGKSKMLALGSQVIPFFNAYLAASYVAYKTATGTNTVASTRAEALKTLGATAAVVMTMSFLYAMMMGGDDEYEKATDEKRNRLLMIPGTGTGIPLRPDMFLLPKIAGEHAYRIMTEQGTTDGAKFREAMTEAIKNTVLGPTAVPQVVKPVLEVGLNRSFYTGRPLVGIYQQPLEASLQYTETTSELAKALSAAAGRDVVSPIAIDHIVRGMFGSIGGTMLYGANLIMGQTGDVERADLSFRDALATFPGLSSVMTKSNESGLKADFYKLREATRNANATYNHVEKNLPQMLETYEADEKFMGRLERASEMEAVARELSAIRAERNLIANDPDMSAEEKRAAKEELDAAEREILGSLPIRELREQVKP